MKEVIQHEPHDETAWICLCGNMPDTDGFATCDPSGDEIEPTLESDWHGDYRCQRCYRIIDQASLEVMGIAPRSYRLTWQGTEIEVRYTPRKWGVIAHLEVRSIAPEGAPLSITETGYRSHFHPVGTIEAHGGDVVGQVTAWLDEEAAKPAWLAYIQRSRQGELF